MDQIAIITYMVKSLHISFRVVECNNHNGLDVTILKDVHFREELCNHHGGKKR